MLAKVVKIFRRNTMGKEQKGYYLGLDIGTGSVGWAVTDKNYQLCKANGKALWGVRLFETAKTAEERRTFRSQRRRNQRKKQRIELLQELFAEEIYKTDTGFYLRMKESRYFPEDKRDETGNVPVLPYALFVDDEFTDKEYHREFPTIYHLRSALLHEDRKFDLRLIYLAIHHILKHRGHFLFEGEMNKEGNFKDIFDTFWQEVCDNGKIGIETFPDTEALKEVEDILKDKNLGRSTKKSRLVQSLGLKTKQEKALAGLLSGTTESLDVIFDDEELKSLENNKICFCNANYEENADKLEEALNENYYLIEKAKAIYDWALLADILGQNEYLSDAKKETYEKHKRDLALLKKVIKENCPEEYKNIFSLEKKGKANYASYIGMYKVNGKKKELEEKGCTKEEFYSYIKSILKNLNDNEDIIYIKNEIENNQFMPKQMIKDNGVIPSQLHKKELERILDNSAKYYPFLLEKDEKGLSVKDKIIAIFGFRIPYYVGPLNGYHKDSGFYWAKRKENGKIYPWNLEEMIDMEASAEKFIRRMTNKCTYLVGKDVLPKNSLLYSKFMVLNELNNLRINDEKISVELKQKIYNELFKKNKRVTKKKLENFLKTEGIFGNNDAISGIDGDFKSSLTVYIDLKGILNNSLPSEVEIEELVKDITLFRDDKKLLKGRIKRRFPDFTDKQIEAISKLPYKDWGRLSKEFLTELVSVNKETEELLSIISMLYETNNNLMQLLSKEYDYVEKIEEMNALEDKQEGLTYKAVENMYVSPAVKRQTWQTIEIIKEVNKIMGREPERIFIEMAREKQESRRTQSRKDRLKELYKQCKQEERDWILELEEKGDNRLRSDRLFLYYAQMGRCMYSGEEIELDDLYNDNLYDIDHIYPQSKVMDDSIDNRVLVKKTLNAEKSDNYPLKKEIRDKNKGFWKMLLDKGFISKEKYKRLVRSEKFTTEEYAGFISRQLVETRQSTKAVADLLKRNYKETEIVYVKAGNVSQFRKSRDLIKVREVNDYHHAKDAYLNIVVGNVYHTKFTADAVWFIKNNPGRSYNLKKMFDFDVERNGEIAWRSGDNGTIGLVKKVMSKNNIMFTRYSYEAKGGLFKQQLVKKGKGQVPIKGSDSRLTSLLEDGRLKYGGYNEAAGAYYMLVESKGKKDEFIRTIEFIPVYLASKFENDRQALIEYCINICNLKEPKIILYKIKKDTLFCIDGFYMYLSSRSGNQIIFKNANQLCICKEDELLIKSMAKFLERKKENKGIVISEKDGITKNRLIELYDIFYSKLEKTVYSKCYSSQRKTLKEGREKFLSLNNEEKCEVLMEILHLFQCKNGSANIKMIGGSGRAERISKSSNITKINDIKIIYQSPTGFFEQVIDLQKI